MKKTVLKGAALLIAPPVSGQLSIHLRSPSRLAVFKHDMQHSLDCKGDAVLIKRKARRKALYR